MMEKKAAENTGIRKRNQLKSVWFRYKRNNLAMFGLILLVMMLLIAIFAGIIVDYDLDVVEQNMSDRLLPMSSEHFFGTDQYGRDIFARIIYGARISLFVSLATICISTVVLKLLSRGNVRFFDFHEGRYFWTSAFRSC